MNTKFSNCLLVRARTVMSYFELTNRALFCRFQRPIVFISRKSKFFHNIYFLINKLYFFTVRLSSNMSTHDSNLLGILPNKTRF